MYGKILLNVAKSGPQKGVERDYPILFPHMFMYGMYHDFSSESDKFVVGTGQFRTNIPWSDPCPEGHPLSRKHGGRDCAIPLRRHGGGVPIAKAKHRSMDVVSLSSMSGEPAPTRNVQYLSLAIAGVQKKQANAW